MNPRIALPLLAAVLAALGALALHLHERHDHLRVRPIPPLDAGPLFERLAARSFAVLEELKVDVAEGGAAWAPLAAALPGPDEPWIDRAEEIVTGRPASSAPDRDEESARFVAPRDLVLPGRRLLRLRELPRPPVRLRVRQLDDGVERGAAWPGGDAVLLPESCALAAGHRHEIEVLDAEGRVLARTRCETINDEALVELRATAAAVGARVRDPALRRYAQGVLAMSRGLHDRAAELLLDGHEGPLLDPRPVDLAWRRVFLLDRRGETTARNQLAATLRGL